MGPFKTPLSDMHSLPTPSGLQQCQLPGQAPQKEPRLLEPPLPWGPGPQGPHLVAIEEEKL